jgi:hypothetical protein
MYNFNTTFFTVSLNLLIHILLLILQNIYFQANVNLPPDNPPPLASRHFAMPFLPQVAANKYKQANDEFLFIVIYILIFQLKRQSTTKEESLIKPCLRKLTISNKVLLFVSPHVQFSTYLVFLSKMSTCYQKSIAPQLPVALECHSLPPPAQVMKVS